MVKYKIEVNNMNAKKIIPMICLIIIALLVVATIVLAVVPKSYIPVNANPDRISIVDSVGNSKVYEKDNEDTKTIYNNLYNEYSKSFTESSINSMFNGRLSYAPVAEYNDTATRVSSFGNNYIMFTYAEQKTVKVDGVEYSYNRMVIALSSTDVMKTVKAYLYNDDTYTNGTNYYINTIGNIDGLVNYVNSIN